MTAPLRKHSGYTLMELLAVLLLLGILAGWVLARTSSHTAGAKKRACELNQGEIELQIRLWRRNTQSWPTAGLTDIGANPAYFPQGVPTCPVDGTPYTIDTTSGQVIGHNH